MRLALAPTIAIAAVACGESLSGLAAPPPDEAGAPDSGPSDAGTTNDGAPNDAGATDADAARFCMSLIPAPDFCDDFDDGQPLAPSWVTTANNATVAKSNGAASIETPLLADGVVARGTIGRASPRSGTLEVTFKLRADQVPLKSLTAANITVSSGNAFYDIQLALLAGTEISLAEYAEPGFDGNPYFSSGSTPFAADYVAKWRTIRIEVTLEGTPRARLFYDDGPFAVIDKAITPTVISNMATVSLGVSFLRGAAKPTVLRYDDVVIRLK